MPNLTYAYLGDYAFNSSKNVTIIGSTPHLSLSQVDIGALRPYFGHKECWSSKRVPDYTPELVIGEMQCNQASMTVLELSRYPLLKTLRIGDLSFWYVNETKLIGMSELESVVIGGMNHLYVRQGHFYVRNCPKLKSLKIGSSSFSSYSVFEIANVDALEAIEMGGDSFHWS